MYLSRKTLKLSRFKNFKNFPKISKRFNAFHPYKMCRHTYLKPIALRTIWIKKTERCCVTNKRHRRKFQIIHIGPTNATETSSRGHESCSDASTIAINPFSRTAVQVTCAALYRFVIVDAAGETVSRRAFKALDWQLPRVKYPWTSGPSMSPNTMVMPVRRHLYLYTGTTFSNFE